MINRILSPVLMFLMMSVPALVMLALQLSTTVVQAGADANGFLGRGYHSVIERQLHGVVPGTDSPEQLVARQADQKGC